MSETLENDRHTESNHTEIELLLPWFVNGTLNERDRKRVSEHVAHCVECQSEVEICESMRAAVNQKSPATITPRPDSAALLRALDERPSTPAKQVRWVQTFAAAAAVVAIVAISMLIDDVDRAGITPQMFDTATDSTTQLSAGLGATLNISFQRSATQAQKHQILHDLGAEFPADFTIADSIEVSVNTQANTLAELESYRDNITARGAVDSIQMSIVPAMQKDSE